MQDQEQTEQELVDELAKLRQRIAELAGAQVQRREAEEALRTSEARFRALVAAVPDLIIRIKRDGTFLDFSPATEFSTYVPPDQFLGAKMQDIMPPGALEPCMAAVEEALRSRQQQTVQYQLPEAHGVRHYEARIAVGGPDDVVAIVRDITKRTKAEDALQQSERRYRELVENSQGLISTHDLEGKLLSVNPAAAQSLGYEPSDAVGMHLFQLLAPAVRHLLQDYLDRVRRDGNASGLMRVISKSGEERIWAYRNVLREEKGQAPYVIGHALDVTDIKRAEQRARRSEARYRALVEHAPCGVYKVSPNGNFLAVNPALVKMLGYASEKELLSADVARDVYTDGVQQSQLLQQHADTSWIDPLEVEWRRQDGTSLSVRLSGRPVRSEGGELECFEMIAEEMTGQRAALR